MKLVSVVIPLYNAQDFIEETIQSVLDQDHANVEIIVIDDGSTDNSAEIVKQLSAKDNRVNYHYQNNAGVSKARNHGIEKSKGEFLFFLDADDTWDKNNVSERLAFFEQHTNVDWIFGGLKLMDENSETLNETVKGKQGNVLEGLLGWNGNVITTPSSLSVRSTALGKLRFDAAFSTAADQDFAIQLAAQCTGRYFEKALVNYRVLPNSMSRNIQHMEEDHIGVFKKAAQLNLFKGYWFKQKCFSNLYWILAGSWWKNGNNKSRGCYFILKGLLANPLSFVRLFKV